MQCPQLPNNIFYLYNKCKTTDTYFLKSDNRSCNMPSTTRKSSLRYFNLTLILFASDWLSTFSSSGREFPHAALSLDVLWAVALKKASLLRNTLSSPHGPADGSALSVGRTEMPSPLLEISPSLLDVVCLMVTVGWLPDASIGRFLCSPIHKEKNNFSEIVMKQFRYWVIFTFRRSFNSILCSISFTCRISPPVTPFQYVNSSEERFICVSYTSS